MSFRKTKLLDCSLILVNLAKDLKPSQGWTLLTDGVKDKGATEQVQVKDIAELVLEAIG